MAQMFWGKFLTISCLGLGIATANAQTPTGFPRGAVIKADQLNASMARKQDYPNIGAGCNGTFAAGTICNNPTSSASVPIPTVNPVLGSASGNIQGTITLTPGNTPGLLANGQIWVTNLGVFAQVNGSTVALGGAATFADPSALVGLTAVNGTALTGIRSDGAPALSQSIVPTWTGFHTFSAGGASTTPNPGDNTTKIATTAFVSTALTSLFANPTATIGLTAVNGSSVFAMRSDAAPALNQTISPTWTGLHTFTGAISINATVGGCSQTPGTRGPLYICNDIAGNNLAGQNAGMQIWIGNNPTGTPGANGPVGQTIYIDNLNSRAEIWATNMVCGQQNTSFGSGAVNSLVHCNETNIYASIAVATPTSAFTGGFPTHAYESVCNQNTGTTPQPCQAAFWVWAAGDYANSTSSQFQPWNFGYAAARVQQAGFDCETNPLGAADTGTYFKQGCLWDQSNSATSYQITGTHTSIIDASGATFTNIVNCGTHLCTFAGSGGVNIAGYLYATRNGAGFPNAPSAGLAMGWNFTAAQAEVDFWNTFIGGSTTSFQWRQQTGVSSGNVLMSLLPSGNLNVTGTITASIASITSPSGLSTTFTSTATGTGSTGGTQQYFNLFNIQSDNVDAGSSPSTSYVLGLHVNHAFGGSSATGGRYGNFTNLYQLNATNSSNAVRFYVAVGGQGQSNSGDGGTIGGGLEKGQIFGGNFLGVLNTGATGYEIVAGTLNQVYMISTSSAKIKAAVINELGETDAVQGSTYDALEMFSAKTGASVFAKNGILFGNMRGAYPLGGSSTIIATVGTTTVNYGIDFSTWGFNTCAFNISFGCVINPAGRLAAPSAILTSSTPTVGGSQVGYGSTVNTAGSGNCPSTVSTSISATQAVQGCLVINVGGTARQIPFLTSP